MFYVTRRAIKRVGSCNKKSFKLIYCSEYQRSRHFLIFHSFSVISGHYWALADRGTLYFIITSGRLVV